MQGWPRKYQGDLGGAGHLELKSEQMPQDASNTGPHGEGGRMAPLLCQSLLVPR